MKLKTLKLRSFRGYHNIEVDFDKDFNVIIGENDVGKSTILEALEIFFNNDLIKLEREDLNVKGDKDELSIGVVFEIDKDKQYCIDSTNMTNLGEEYLLNEKGDLEIHKVWNCSGKKITASCLTIFLKANYLSEYKDNPLISLKISELRAELKMLESEINEYESVKKDTSSSIRRAIYSASENKDTELISIPMNSKDGKKLYESISREFPMFFLFQSDRGNMDSDKEIQDPLKVITKEVIKEVEDELDKVKEKIQDRAIEIGEKTLEKLSEMSPDIAKVLRPNIKHKAWDSLFSFTFESDEGIPMNKRGSGVRRLIILNYFRAEAERKNTEKKQIIYAIEEPETAQHPNHQIMLMKALLELGEQDNRQVIITTHTPEIAKMVSSKNLILIKREEDKPTIIEGENKLENIAHTLGLLPYYAKLAICVEGEFDILFLKGINAAIDELKNIIDLEKENITFIPMIGSNLTNWITRDYLGGSNIIEYHIYDKDNDGKYEKYIKKIKERDDGSMADLTERREMENYIHHSLIESHFNICVRDKVEGWDVVDVPTLVFDKTGREMKKSDIKRIINGQLVQGMTKEYLEEMGAYTEVKSWFEKIKLLYMTC